MSNVSTTVLAGAAMVDITPLPGLMMCGYAARTAPAVGTHDPLTARALVVGDTAVVVADVLGIDEHSSARVRARSGFADDRIVVVATHTHGGPMSMAERGGGRADLQFLKQLEDGCVDAIRQAAARRLPARLFAGNGADPGIAFNRRRDGGPIDPNVPVLRVEGLDGSVMAVLFAHGCHPVVLGAGNRLYTSDFPHYARAAVETAVPDAVALFLPGCSGDVSTGHSPESSISTDVPPDRTFEEAERLGLKLAASVLATPLRLVEGKLGANGKAVELPLASSETNDLDVLAETWEAMAGTAAPAWSVLYRHWSEWARTTAREPLKPWRGRVTRLLWGDIPLIFLPGEIFASTALAIRASHPNTSALFAVSLADGNPGYIPPHDEYTRGGYEVTEAHRYYGMPAAFAPGAAEILAAAVGELSEGDAEQR